jgi:hypothetical protein
MKNSKINVSNYPEQRELNDYELVDHLEASISNESYRIYIAENVWIFPGQTRLDVLKDILKAAKKRKEYELCARVKSVYEQLSEKYKSDGVI